MHYNIMYKVQCYTENNVQCSAIQYHIMTYYTVLYLDFTLLYHIMMYYIVQDHIGLLF